MFALFRLRDKGLLSDARIRAPGRRLPVPAQPGAPAANRRGPADPHPARRSGRAGAAGAQDAGRRQPAPRSTARRCERELDEHLAEVREIYERVIHAQQPMYYTPLEQPDAAAAETSRNAPPAGQQPGARCSTSARRDWPPRWPAANLRRGRERFEHFLEKAMRQPGPAGAPGRRSALAGCVLDIFEHSPYFAEQLIRHPELLEEMRPSRFRARRRSRSQDGAALRRFYRRQMLRIQCESICGRRPSSTTLGKHLRSWPTR